MASPTDSNIADEGVVYPALLGMKTVLSTNYYAGFPDRVVVSGGHNHCMVGHLPASVAQEPDSVGLVTALGQRDCGTEPPINKAGEGLRDRISYFNHVARSLGKTRPSNQAFKAIVGDLELRHGTQNGDRTAGAQTRTPNQVDLSSRISSIARATAPDNQVTAAAGDSSGRLSTGSTFYKGLYRNSARPTLSPVQIETVAQHNQPPSLVVINGHRYYLDHTAKSKREAASFTHEASITTAPEELHIPKAPKMAHVQPVPPDDSYLAALREHESVSQEYRKNTHHSVVYLRGLGNIDLGFPPQWAPPRFDSPEYELVPEHAPQHPSPAVSGFTQEKPSIAHKGKDGMAIYGDSILGPPLGGIDDKLQREGPIMMLLHDAKEGPGYQSMENSFSDNHLPDGLVRSVSTCELLSPSPSRVATELKRLLKLDDGDDCFERAESDGLPDRCWLGEVKTCSEDANEGSCNSLTSLDKMDRTALWVQFSLP